MCLSTGDLHGRQRSHRSVRKARSDAGVGMGRPLVSVQLNGTAQDLASLARVLPDVIKASNASSSSLRVESLPEEFDPWL